jgi:hypothetical protein
MRIALARCAGMMSVSPRFHETLDPSPLSHYRSQTMIMPGSRVVRIRRIREILRVPRPRLWFRLTAAPLSRRPGGRVSFHQAVL